MDVQSAPFQRIVVLTYPGVNGGPEEAEKMAAFLRQGGVTETAWGSFLDRPLVAQVEAGHFDLLVSVGGDGSMLRAGHLCAPRGIPFVGVNLGRFGFLTEIQRGEWRDGLTRLLEGRYRIEDRMLLHAEHVRAGQVINSSLVINEVVACRGQYVRPIRVRACVDGFTLANYVSDGVIAATSTGSTGYALAANGPILPPELRNILIIPVAPHLTMDRAIILPEGAHVAFTAFTDHEAVMSVDGQPPLQLQDGDEVRVEANDFPARFVRFQNPGAFYRTINAYMEQNPSAGAH
jgi:NAD+ kinase